jgi:hypothetical protein
MKKIFIGSGVLAGMLTSYSVAFAQTSGLNTQYLQGYSTTFVNLINGVLVPVLMAVAFIVFLYGVYKYFIYGGDDEEARKTGRQFVLWGVIGFAVIMSLWGLVNLLAQTFNLGQFGTGPQSYPQIPASAPSVQ